MNSVELVGGPTFAPGDQVEIRYDATDETGIDGAIFRFMSAGGNLLTVVDHDRDGTAFYTIPDN